MENYLFAPLEKALTQMLERPGLPHLIITHLDTEHFVQFSTHLKRGLTLDAPALPLECIPNAIQRGMREMPLPDGLERQTTLQYDFQTQHVPLAAAFTCTLFQEVLGASLKGNYELSTEDDSSIYIMTPQYQLQRWAEGTSLHNHYNPVINVVDNEGNVVNTVTPLNGEGECCPDFSCCGSPLAPEPIRRRFAQAQGAERDRMLGEFLGGILEKEGLAADTTILTQPDVGECTVCGETDELRPYGVDGANICVTCLKKDPEAMQRMKDILS